MQTDFVSVSKIWILHLCRVIRAYRSCRSGRYKDGSRQIVPKNTDGLYKTSYISFGYHIKKKTATKDRIRVSQNGDVLEC